MGNGLTQFLELPPYLIHIHTYYSLLGESTDPVSLPTFGLSTWMPPWGSMSFAPMLASNRIDREHVHLSKTISFWPFFWLTFKWTHPYTLLQSRDHATWFTGFINKIYSSTGRFGSLMDINVLQTMFKHFTSIYWLLSLCYYQSPRKKRASVGMTKDIVLSLVWPGSYMYR